MKFASVSCLSLACLLGLLLGAEADSYGFGSTMGMGGMTMGGMGMGGYGGYGGGYTYMPMYGGYPSGGRRGMGNGALLGLIGVLFLVMLLFSGAFNTTSSSSGSTISLISG